YANTNDVERTEERVDDLFVGVMTGRSGRNDQAFTADGPVNIRNAQFAEDLGPLDASCTCPVCKTYSRAYLHHLVRSKEILGAMLMTEHNISYYQSLMAGMREAIAVGVFATFASNFRKRYLRQ